MTDAFIFLIPDRTLQNYGVALLPLRMFPRLVVFSLLLSTILSAQPQWQQAEALSALNSAKDDFAPCWDAMHHRLSFSSVRSGRSRLYEFDSTQNKDVELNLFPQLPRCQYAFLSLSSVGDAVCTMFRSAERQRIPNLAACQYTNGLWSTPTSILSLQDDHYVGQASISPSGQTLVFSSDRQGGEGGTDLWICSRNGSVWGVPMNLGESINSPGDEITPFLQSDDTLYFASNGSGGRGGFDVFICVYVAGEWQPPLPLTTINTAFNESDFIVLPDGRAVFASDRTGSKGGLDLYIAEKEVPKPSSN